MIKRFYVGKTTKLVATCDCPEGADSFEVGKCQQLFEDALKKSGISDYHNARRNRALW